MIITVTHNAMTMTTGTMMTGRALPVASSGR